MQDDPRQRAEQLFLEAVEVSAEEREAFLDRRCGNDGSLREAVRRLLDAREKMGDFLERLPESLGDAEPSEDETLPTRIGGYEIVRVVGTGGMGIVYEAQQDHPHRRVALKVIHPALASSQWLRRFQREAEVLGRLQHPGIATIYEAGEAEVLIPGRPAARQPFLAMEYVDGANLRKHADTTALDMRERLELVARICDAMQHAHERGIVHRDLKPSNILVDTEGQPKVLDFGIARATGDDWTAMTVATMTGQIIGTIPYMSPEQVGGRSGDVDVRSDVYALGVILYELLSGRLPVETRDRSLPETLRAIREDEPSGLGSLNSAFRGDIDAIVGKALRKEPERRYATAGKLGDDIRRYLRGEPIRARPASTTYQLRRFARRNKALVGGVAATIVALILGLIVATGFARREARQRRIAEAMTSEAQRAAHEARFTAAIASLDSLKPTAAARSLDAVPEKLRKWEWRHLRWRAGQHLAEIPPPQGGLFSMSVAQRASLLFTADGEGTVRVWSLETGEKVRELSTEPCPTRGPMAASPDGTLLLGTLTGAESAPRSERRRLVAWDAQSGRELWRRPGAFDLGRPLWRRPGGHRLGDDAYSEDGSLVAVSPWGGRSILLLDPRTGKVRETIPVPDETAKTPIFSPDGSKLIYLTESISGIVDRATRRTTRLRLGTAGFSDGGDTAIAHNGREAVLVDLETGNRTLFPGVRPVDWPVGLSLLAIGEPAFDAPFRRFLVPGDASTVVRRLGDGKITAHLGTTADPVGWTGDGKRVVTNDENEFVRIWDAATDSRPARIAAPPRRRNEIYAMSPDGKRYATSSWRFVTLYDLETGAERWHAYELEPYVKALAFSPDGLQLAVGADEGNVTILDAETGAVLRVLPVLSEVIGGLAWLSTGNSIVIASREGTVRWIDAMTGNTMGELALPDERFPCHGKSRSGPNHPCIGVSADGARLAVAGEFPPGQVAGVAVWEIASGRRLGVFRIDSGWIGGIALDPTGDRLAALVRKRRYESKERDGLTVWNVGSGERIMDRAYERVSLYSLLFSPEGNRIVLGGDDGKVRFLDAEGDLQDVVLEMGNLGIVSLSLASDGSKIVVGTQEELVLLETGPPSGGWAARARASEARDLVDELFHDLKFAEDVTDRLREDADLPEEIRLAALDLARIRGDHHGWLNSDAIMGSRATSLSQDELRLILRKAELANRLWPDHPGYVATLGKCRYRAGSYREALETMDRAEALHRSAGGTLDPEDLAFVAMIRWRLGERDSARQSMRSLESLLTGRTDEVGSGTLASIDEARTLIGTRRGGLTSGSLRNSWTGPG